LSKTWDSLHKERTAQRLKPVYIAFPKGHGSKADALPKSPKGSGRGRPDPRKMASRLDFDYVPVLKIPVSVNRLTKNTRNS